MVLSVWKPVARCRTCGADRVRLYENFKNGHIACNKHIPWPLKQGWTPLYVDPLGVPISISDEPMTDVRKAFRNMPESSNDPNAPTWSSLHGWTTHSFIARFCRKGSLSYFLGTTQVVAHVDG